MVAGRHQGSEVVEAVVSALTTALGRPTTYSGQLREVASLAACVARYPLGIFEDAQVDDPSSVGTHDTPVLLVHGYGHNRSAWYMLERHLRAVSPFHPRLATSVLGEEAVLHGAVNAALEAAQSRLFNRQPLSGIAVV